MGSNDARSDAELLAATPGDPNAFAVFYRRHVADVIVFVSRRVGRDEVGDVVSEVFAASLVHRRRFDPARGTAGAWLAGIATHKIADLRRRGYAETRLYRRIGATRVAAAVELEPDADSGFLDGLPAKQRDAVAMRVIAERTYEQIANEQRVSEQTARKRVSRALRSLRTRFEQEGQR